MIIVKYIDENGKHLSIKEALKQLKNSINVYVYLYDTKTKKALIDYFSFMRCMDDGKGYITYIVQSAYKFNEIHCFINIKEAYRHAIQYCYNKFNECCA